uniref:Uncharacterized protein n=1 Tax=Oryza sativa subsp. japonica TaxID=39947 RepID=Q6K8V0_ORYSJ|nr:hypothetical protein [Oryza sativa Japonica Group]BAD19310.1 hypothetical protein [Oryza sativa Japonica Group]
MATLPVAVGTARRAPNVGWRTSERGKVVVAAFWLRPRCWGGRRRGGGEAEEARIGMRWRRRGVGGEAVSSRRPRGFAARHSCRSRRLATPSSSRRPAIPPTFRRPVAPTELMPPRHSAKVPPLRRAPTAPSLLPPPPSSRCPAAPPLHQAPAELALSISLAVRIKRKGKCN